MEIVSLAQRQLDQATALSQAENWPHRLQDWQMLMTLSQGRAALRDGVVIGTALRTDFGPDVSLLNMIIVQRSERGQRIGYKLMSSLMDEVSGRELRLVATKAGIPLYEKLGFESEGEIFQCQGEIASVGLPDEEINPAKPDD
ncbi:MAG TPA: GNAT family N-acetyltransferase, partial [Gammaproteobacteria bacterium]|nr:GNAT family N-acetyltransferase [Gammaproteobacteria bacterium]